MALRSVDQCVAVHVKFLLTIFEDGEVKFPLAGRHVAHNQHTVYCMPRVLLVKFKMLYSEEVIYYDCKFSHQYPDPLLLRKVCAGRIIELIFYEMFYSE
jgi:hypothetical protein